MSKKSDDARAASNRIAQKFDSNTYASPEAQAAADQAVAEGLTVEGAFRPGEELFGIKPLGSPEEKDGPGRWRVADVRAALVARKIRKEREAEEEAAPVAEMTEAPAEQAPEIIEVQPIESVDEWAARKAAEAEEVEAEPAGPTPSERIRDLWSVVRKVAVVGVRSLTVGILAGIAIVAGLTVRFNWAAGYRDPVILGIFSVIATAFGGFAGILAYHWRPKWHRPSWLHVPKIGRPRIGAALTKKRHLPARAPLWLVGLVLVALLTGLVVSTVHPWGRVRQWLAAPEQQHIVALTQEKVGLEEQTAALESERANLQLENEQLQAQLETAQEIAIAIDVVNADLQVALATSQAACAALDAEKEALQATFDTELATERDEAKAAYAVLEEAYNKLNAERHELANRVEELETEKTNLETAVAETGAERAMFETAYVTAAKERDQLAATLAEITQVTVEEGDTLWDLAIEVLGQVPTWDQIVGFAEAYDLEHHIDDGGTPDDQSDDQLVVYIRPGETYDLAVMISG